MARSSIFNYESLVHATAGAAGSVIAHFVFYPLETIKFRLQLSDPNLLDKSIVEALLYILQKDGLNGLYQGLTPILKSLGVSNFVYFYAFHGLKSLESSDQKSARTDLQWSIIAGIINVLATCPLCVVSSRLKACPSDYYSGLIDGMLHIGKTEGLASLWSGVGSSLLLVSNPAIQFTVYEALKRRIPTKSALSFFLMGAVSKAVATVLTYPLQVVQTRQRTNSIDINTVSLLLLILKQDGVGGLFQGLEAKLSQTVLAGALMFMTYEKISRYTFKILMMHRVKS